MRRAKLTTYVNMLKVLSDDGPSSTKQLMFELKMFKPDLNEKINFLMNLKLIEKNETVKNNDFFSVTQKGIRVIRFFYSKKIILPLKDEESGLRR